MSTARATMNEFIITVVMGFIALVSVTSFMNLILWRSTSKKLAKKPPHRMATIQEQQTLNIVYKRSFGLGSVYQVKGKFRHAGSTYYRIDSDEVYYVKAHHPHLKREKAVSDDDNQAEILVDNNTAYLMSLNGEALTELYQLQWEASFAMPSDEVSALNIEVKGRRALTPDETLQLSFEEKANDHVTIILLLGLALVFSFRLYPFYGDFDFFAALVPLAIGLYYLPRLLTHHWPHLKIGRPGGYCSDHIVTLAQGTVAGCDGKQVWFSGEANTPPEDPNLRFRLPSLYPNTTLKPGETVDFAFVGSHWLSKKECSPALVLIENHYSAEKEYWDAPFMRWDEPVCTLILGLTPLCLIIETFWGYWSFALVFDLIGVPLLVLLMSVGWVLLGGTILLSRYQRLRRSIRLAKICLGPDYKPFKKSYQESKRASQSN